MGLEKGKARQSLFNEYQLPCNGIGGGREGVINSFCLYEHLYCLSRYNEECFGNFKTILYSINGLRKRNRQQWLLVSRRDLISLDGVKT